MASNKQLNQTQSNQLIGQFNQVNKINQLNTINQLGNLNPLISSTINSSIASINTSLTAPINSSINQFNPHITGFNSELNSNLLHQKNEFILNNKEPTSLIDNLPIDKGKKKGAKGGKKDSISKSSLQFNYQNLNVNLNPKERKLVNQDQIKLLHHKASESANNDYQFKILPTNDDGTSSFKFKIATTRKPAGSNSELRKLRIPNQNLTNVQQTKQDNLNQDGQTISQTSNSTVQTTIPTTSISTVQPNIHLNIPAAIQSQLTNNVIKNQKQIELINNNKNLPNFKPSTNQLIGNLPANLNKNLQINNQPSNQLINKSINKPTIHKQTITDNVTVIKNKASPVEVASGILNKPIANIASPDNPSDHGDNCTCLLHAGKDKKHPNQLNNSNHSQTNKDLNFNKSQNPKQKYLENSKDRSSSSSSDTSSNSSSSSRSTSSSNSSSRSSSSSSSSSGSRSSTSGSSSSDSSNSSDCSESSCSASSSSTNSRSVSRTSCETCHNRSSSSNSSSSSSSSDNEESCKIASLNRGRTRKKEAHKIQSPTIHKQKIQSQSKLANSKAASEKNKIDQLLHNVNESLIKQQKQKLNLSQLNSTIASPFSPDVPSPSSNLNSNANNLNSFSQPSSVSCESNCYSPTVSLNSPSCQVGTKRTTIEERQRLRSYRLPNLNVSKEKREDNKNKSERDNKETNRHQDALNQSTTTNEQMKDQPKKIKKQKLKGEKKKDKLKKLSLKKKDEKIDGQELPKSKKKGKKLKQTDEQAKLVKKTKKKSKKKGKLNKKLISDAKLIENLDLVKLLNPSNLTSSNSKSELSKMALLMNANLNMGIPPKIDKNYILPGLSSLIEQDSSILTKQNQFLLNKNKNLIINSNNLNLNQESTSSKNPQTIESQSANVKQSDKSPDSGIQSQSESPNQFNTNVNATTMINDSKKKPKKATSKQQVNIPNKPSNQTLSNPLINASNGSKDLNNQPKKNSLLVNQISNISTNLQKDPLFNQFMDNSLQSLLKNLQKTSANLVSNLNVNQPTTSTQSILNTNNFNMIKPKSVPSDLITLTEILLNMNKNKDTNSTSLPSNPITNLASNVSSGNTNQSSNSTSTAKTLGNFNDKQKKTSSKSFKQISTADNQLLTTCNQLNIKNTDLWRNTIDLASSPLMLDELNKRLRTSTAKLDDKKVISNKQQSSKQTKTKSSKKSKKGQEFLPSVSAKELNKSLALNQHLNKNLLSDLLCVNEQQDESNQQLSSRSVSSLSQNHYTTDKNGKKKKKKHKSKKSKQDGRIGELSDELNKIYLNLEDELSRLRIQTLKDSTTNRNAGVFKCVKYSSGKSKKSKSKSTIQFNCSAPMLNGKQTTLLNDSSIDKNTSKKRKKNSSISLDQQQNSKKQIEKSNSNENANEHSLPLKKRHHRHTENDGSSLDLVDSSNSSSTTDLSNLSSSIKINLRKAASKSTRSKANSKTTIVDDLSANQPIDSTQRTLPNLTNATKTTLEISQTNSCALVTWANSKQNNNDHSTVETTGRQNTSMNQTANSKNRPNVDSKLIDQLNLSIESSSFNGSNMIITRNQNSNPSARKLRSNQPNSINHQESSQTMGSVKSKFVNSNSSDQSMDTAKNEVTDTPVPNKRLRNKSSLIANENSNLNISTAIQPQQSQVKKSANKKPSNAKAQDSSSDNLLKPKTIPTIVKKKRKKQNKTGFDKPKKRKKILPKFVVQEPVASENMNEHALNETVDELSSAKQSENNKANSNEKCSTSDSPQMKVDEIELNDNKKSAQNCKRELKPAKAKVKSSDVKSNLIKPSDVKITKVDELTDVEVPTKKTAVKLKKLTNKLKSKNFNLDTCKQLNKTKLNKSKLKKNKLLTAKKQSNKPVNNKKKELKRKLSEDDQQSDQEQSTKQIKLDKSNACKSTVNHKQQPPISVIQEENNKPDDDFEEIVLKIHSVLSTTLTKKPKQSKIKIKGPVKYVKYYKAGLFSDTFKEDPPSETNTSASNTPVHQCETPLMDENTVQSDNDDLIVKDDTLTASNSPISNTNEESELKEELKEGKLRFEDKDAQYNGKEPVTTDNDEYSTLLPPPTYVYNKERRKLNDFLLPYDIWWQHVNNQLTHTINPAKNYKKVKGNVFFDVKPTSNFEEQSCVCVRPSSPNQIGKYRKTIEFLIQRHFQLI